MLVHFSRREYRCQPGLHRPGCGGSTPPSRRVSFGLQALQRCSGLLNRRARGSTVATHHFADVAQQRQQQFRKLPGALPHESASLSIGSISASVVKLLSSSASNGEFAGGSPAGCTKFTGMWLNPNSRGSRLRICEPWRCKSSLAHQFHGVEATADRHRTFNPVW